MLGQMARHLTAGGFKKIAVFPVKMFVPRRGMGQHYKSEQALVQNQRRDQPGAGYNAQPSWHFEFSKTLVKAGVTLVFIQVDNPFLDFEKPYQRTVRRLCCRQRLFHVPVGRWLETIVLSPHPERASGAADHLRDGADST